MTFGEAFAFEEENLSLVVGEDLDGERLDVFLAWKLDRTRSHIQALIREGRSGSKGARRQSRRWWSETEWVSAFRWNPGRHRNSFRNRWISGWSTRMRTSLSLTNPPVY
jgi:hypothetical protein